MIKFFYEDKANTQSLAVFFAPDQKLKPYPNASQTQSKMQAIHCTKYIVTPSSSCICVGIHTSRRSTMYPVILPPPSSAGFSQDRLTKSLPTSSTSGIPGEPGGSATV